MLVSDYNYDLPEERIAKFPPEKRGQTRLLVLNRETGEIKDSYYKDLADFLNPGDVLILNDTKVMPSRLFCTLPDGRKRELVVLENHHDKTQRVMYRGKLHEGDVVTVDIKNDEGKDFETVSEKEGLKTVGRNSNQCDSIEIAGEKGGPMAVNDNSCPQIKIEKILGNGIAEVSSEVSLAELASKYGAVPLPPYLHRDATEADTKRYQTVWAKNLGSAAAPTASLNMTDELLNRLREKGVRICYLTLHVGLGTFLPIRTDKVEEHKMHSEWFEIPEETLKAIAEIKGQFGENHDKTEQNQNNANAVLSSDNRGSGEIIMPTNVAPAGTPSTKNRIVAVGTTVARTLEFYAKTGLTSGEDDIFIYPGFKFQIVDALLTNFHAPKSTVLMLAAAFSGWENLHKAYDYAVKQKYNFLSYGDSMLILGENNA